MSFNRDASTPIRARNAISKLEERGIKLPAGVKSALAVLDRIEADQPRQAPPATAVADLILAGAPPKELTAAAVQQVTYDTIRQGYGEARGAAARQVLDAIAAAGADIHKQLAKLAGERIERLEKAAKITTPLEALVRAGRAADAAIAATAEIDAQELAALYRVRGDLLGRARAEHVSQWRDADHAGCDYITGLQRGGRLWYPTAAEAGRRAAELDAARTDHEQAVLAGTGRR